MLEDGCLETSLKGDIVNREKTWRMGAGRVPQIDRRHRGLPVMRMKKVKPAPAGPPNAISAPARPSAANRLPVVAPILAAAILVWAAAA